VEAAMARATCRKSKALNFPGGVCRPQEAVALAKAYQMYHTLDGECSATAIQASRCDMGVTQVNGNMTTECPITRFDGFTHRLGRTAGHQYHDENPPVTAQAMAGQTPSPSGAQGQQPAANVGGTPAASKQTPTFKDPFTGFDIPMNSVITNCGLLLDLTGTEKPSDMMATQLLVAQLAVCDYVRGRGLVMPECSSPHTNNTIIARNAEVGTQTPTPRAKCEIRLDVPKPKDLQQEKYLALPMAMAALSEICRLGKWDTVLPGDASKKMNDCKISHGSFVLAAGLKYVGGSGVDEENMKAKRGGAAAAAVSDVANAFLGCPWKQGTTGAVDILKCMDGYECNIEWDTPGNGWDCCVHHGGRAQCPLNFPMMCEASNCGGSPHVWPMNSPSNPKSAEHCCEMDCSLKGGNRKCEHSTILASVEKDNLEHQLFHAYQLGFPGAIVTLENQPMVSSMVSMRDRVVQQSFVSTACFSFDCVVDQMMR